MSLTESDLDHAERLLGEFGPGAAYKYLGSKGSEYAPIADGVASENTFAGITAVSFMKEQYCEANRSEMPPHLLGNTKFRMAKEEFYPIIALQEVLGCSRG